MLTLEELKPGQSLVGLEPTVVATIAAVVPIAEGTVQVLYKTPEGTIKERLLNRGDEAAISLATTETTRGCVFGRFATSPNFNESYEFNWTPISLRCYVAVCTLQRDLLVNRAESMQFPLTRPEPIENWHEPR